ncbi:Gldg family protein [Leptospira alexanderi]|uniref:Membrane protein n=1 Tax=Leptospira alexanderi serovar Manhao 3 str. L 60 TaxID=1049759 RepID=V6HSF4_9LEPT|nr:Gldg family protein [Leptospira alexanderi]EQA60480.1 putative membrane protein [Leptospira alexanderi serovar Manhao 3 str. L 60]
MKESVLLRIFPWVSLVSLFLYFPVRDSIQSPVNRWLWMGLVLVILILEPAYRWFRKKNIQEEWNSYISAGLGLIAFGIYHLRVFLEELALKSNSIGSGNERIREILLVLLVLCTIAFLILTLLKELGKDSAGAQSVLKTSKQALVRYFIINLAIVFVALVIVNYISVMRNHNFDLSSKGQYSFSPTAVKILKSVNKEVEVIAFYPRPLENSPSSDKANSFSLRRIRPDLEIYLDQLKSLSPQFKTRFINADVELDDLAEFGQVSNGIILLRTKKPLAESGKQYAEQRLSIREKNDLEDLERKIVQAVVSITTEEKNIYFTQSNGERFSSIFQNLPNEKIGILSNSLSFLNFKVKGLGIAEGWPSRIPENTDVLIIAGPTVAFSKEAQTAVLDFIEKKKGKIFITIDPKGTENFRWLLEKSGYEFAKGPLSQVQGQAGMILAKSFRKHPIEEALSRKDMGVVFPFAGYFVPQTTPESGGKNLEAFPLMESGGESILDKNNNGKQDNGEERRSVILGMILKTIPKVQKEETKQNSATGLSELQQSSTEQKKDSPIGFTDSKQDSQNDPNSPQVSDLKPKNETAPQNTNTDSKEEGRVVIFSGTSWITDQFISYGTNYELATSSITWMYQDLSLSSIQPKKEEINTASLTEVQKRVVWILGMFIFPGLIAFVSSVVLIQKRKREGEES